MAVRLLIEPCYFGNISNRGDLASTYIFLFIIIIISHVLFQVIWINMLALTFGCNWV
jgi:hypothetical protein